MALRIIAFRPRNEEQIRKGLNRSKAYATQSKGIEANIEAEKISTASEFLLLAFFQWQQIEGGKKTNAEFAEWIGITPQQMNQYLESICNVALLC